MAAFIKVRRAKSLVKVHFKLREIGGDGYFQFGILNDNAHKQTRVLKRWKTAAHLLINPPIYQEF